MRAATLPLICLCLTLTACSETPDPAPVVAKRSGAWLFVNNCLQTATQQDVFLCPDGQRYFVE